MLKTVLVTGSTDGIGLETAKMLVAAGHAVLMHGRNPAKLERAAATVSSVPARRTRGAVETFLADLSRMADVEALAAAVRQRHRTLDVLVNNAGVLQSPDPVTPDGLDVRFAVNTLAPHLLTRRLLPIIGGDGRVIHVTSAAQAPVDLHALAGTAKIDEMAAYQQSKLALTMCALHTAAAVGPLGPVVVAVNPGSLLASNMVRDKFGVTASGVGPGGAILSRAALSDDFASASGQYYDNDLGRFAEPHPEAQRPGRVSTVVRARGRAAIVAECRAGLARGHAAPALSRAPAPASGWRVVHSRLAGARRRGAPARRRIRGRAASGGDVVGIYMSGMASVVSRGARAWLGPCAFGPALRLEKTPPGRRGCDRPRPVGCLDSGAHAK